MVYDLFNVLLNFVWQYFVGDIFICVHQGYWSMILFLCDILSGFGIEVILAFKMCLEETSSIFWKNLRGFGINSSLNIWLNSLVKPSDLDFCFLGHFWLLSQSPFQQLIFSDFLCYCDLVLGGYMFLEFINFF